MLVLSRKLNETIVIGEDVRITVLSIVGNQIRLGIEAPKNIAVHRAEVKDKIDEAKRSTDFCETMRQICEDKNDGQ